MFRILVLLVIFNGCHGYQYPFQDPSLDWMTRVNDLVDRLTLQEVVNQSIADYGHPVVDIPRLGIKPYVWITECLHGQVHTNTTAFPQSLGLAATFSTELMYNVSQAISIEVRARWNNNKAQGIYKNFNGLSCFAPVVNILRHPLWGRNQETYGEDPYLTGQIAASYVKGLQGPHPRYARVTAGCKHFAAYDGPENIPYDRHHFNAKVTLRDLYMTYLPAFQTCVNAGVYSIGCTYTSLNGIPTCVDKFILTDIARNTWGFYGYVFSDAGSMGEVISKYHYVNTSAEVAALGIQAGCNLELGSLTYMDTIKAINQGLVTETQVRENIKPMIYTRMRHGEFDPPQMVPYEKIPFSAIQNVQHQQLAIEAAAKSFVLLKNDGLLPLRKLYQRMAIVGPFADNIYELYGDYNSDQDMTRKYAKTPREGLAALAAEQSFAVGCPDPHCTTYNSTNIQNAVTNADIVIVCLGLGVAVEKEAEDRTDIDLPGHQLQLLKEAITAAAGAPLIVLLFNAGALDVSFAVQSSGVGAMMTCFYPGQATGDALYASLTAKYPWAVPAGRLPATWPASLTQYPNITVYAMEGMTYRYFTNVPLFPFGYGLSYTQFKYISIDISPPSIDPGQQVEVKVTVQNVGKYEADEVTQVYISWGPGLPAPIRQLAAFDRISLKPNQTKQAVLIIKPEIMRLWMSESKGYVIPPGEMKVYAGGQQPGQKVMINSNVLTSSFNIKSVTGKKFKTDPRLNWNSYDKHNFKLYQ